MRCMYTICLYTINYNINNNKYNTIFNYKLSHHKKKLNIVKCRAVFYAN